MTFFQTQSITTCVNTCTKTALTKSAQQTAWCLVVSNPNTAAISLRISYTFTDPTNAATSTPTNNTVNGGASPTSGSGSYTTTIVLPSVSGVQKISWNSKGILVIALACVVVIQSFMALI